MRRAAAALALVLLLTACGGDPIPAEYLMIEITTTQAEVTLGKEFAVEVRRVWSKDLEPGEFTEVDLAPLSVRLDQTDRRENDTHVEETRRYLAYAFSAGDLTVSAPLFTATPVLGGAKLAVNGNSLDLTVRGEVDPQAPGDAELPGRLFKPSRIWLPMLVISAIMVLIGYRRTRRGAKTVVEAPRPEPTPLPLDETVLAELDRLRRTKPKGHAGTQALYLELTGILKGYLAERFSLDALRRTTEELTGHPELRGYTLNLRAVFGPCDLVKFAAHRPTDVERELLFDASVDLVRETSAS